MIDVKKLIAQLSNAAVVVQKLPPIKGHLRLVTGHTNKENGSKNTIETNDENDEFFFKEPGKKRASKVSKPFCSKCNITIENQRKKDKCCKTCGTILLYKCMTCRLQYTSYRGIQVHLKTKCDETTLYIQCSACDYATNSQISLTKHIKYVHDNMQPEVFEEYHPRLFNCPFCYKIFNYNANLTNHLKACKLKRPDHISSHENALKSCENNLSYNTTNSDSNILGYSIKYPIKSKTQNLIKHSCLKCNKIRYGVSKVQTPRCKKCDTFLTFNCKKCNKQYENYESIKYHIKSKCNPVAFYQCSKCDYKTTMKYLIRRHIKNMHIRVETSIKLESESFNCFKCDLQLKNADSLRCHERFCGIKPNLFCKLCPYKTRFRQNLKVHLLKVHSEVNEHNFNDYMKILCNKKIIKKPRDESSELKNKKSNSNDSKSSSTIITPTVKELHDKVSEHKKKKPNSSNVSDITKLLKLCCPTCKQEINASKLTSQKCTNCNAKFYYKCTKCGKCMSNYSNAKTHVSSCLNISSAQCMYCKRKIKGYVQLKSHLRYCKVKALTICQYCSYKGKNSSDMDVHKKRCKGINSAEKTNTVESIKSIQNVVSEVKDKVVSDNINSDKLNKKIQKRKVKKNEDKIDGDAFKVKGIDILQKWLTDHIPKITEMAGMYCAKCKKVYEGSSTKKRTFCSQCKNSELYHQCLKCKKEYYHQTSLRFHLQSQCFPVALYTCSICNYSNHIRSIIIKHVRRSKHEIAK